jgi:hypothetical protein
MALVVLTMSKIVLERMVVAVMNGVAVMTGLASVLELLLETSILF